MQLTITEQRRSQLIVSTLLLGLLAFNANALELADEPLTLSAVTSAIPPNVMLLMDNSGSMANMLWSDAYDPSISYPNWRNKKSYSKLKYDKKTKYSEATLNGETRWLKLPEPDGRKTDYDGNYLNFLFETAVYDGSNRADLTINNLIPQNTRIIAAKNAATSLVSDPNNTSMRFGIFKFNKTVGGTLEATCGTDTPTLLSRISGLTADSYTPLAETFHDITKYFRGEGDFTSPIQYRCQQNFVIVVTDGYPTEDMTFNEPNPLYAARIPDWDGLSPNTVAADIPLSIPQYSDGFAPTNSSKATKAGASLYLDDLAKFGYDIDLMPAGTNDLEGNDYNMAPFAKQNLVTHTIGFATDNQMLADAADNSHGRGTYTPTASAAGLSEALNSALSSIKASAQLKSISTSAISSGYLTDDTRIYMTSYASVGNDWTGDIVKYKFVNKVLTLDTNGPITVPADPANRSIYTYDGSSEVLFDDTLGATEKNILCPAIMPAPSTAVNPACTTTKVTALIDYLAGGESGELDGTFRIRSSGLGDIINSAPAFLTKPSFRNPDTLKLPGSTSNYDELYSDFKSSNNTRANHILVGSNAGMLHAFNAATGNETMAYIPRMILGKLKSLSDLNYSHQYFVDGSPTIGDAYYGTTWHTVLASGMNKGAQGVFALDVTDLTDLTSLSPWEFTDTNDVNMGYSYSQPAIVLMSNGKWAAVFGNGFNSNEADGNQGPGNAVLYIVYLGVGEDGFVATEFEVLNTNVTDNAQGGDNGLATVAPVDIDGDFDIDIIYAGDLKGNLWKFNVSSSTPSNWGESASISKLFSRCTSTGDVNNVAEVACLQRGDQAITTRPEVGRGPMSNSFLVYFGTGKYLENRDPDDMSVQSFYAIVDESLANTTTVNAAQLQAQTIVQQGVFSITDPNDSTSTLPLTDTLRVTSDTAVNYGTKKGWYIDLTYNNVTQGERVISNPMLRNGRIIVTTNYYTSSGGGGNNQSLSCSANTMSVSGKGWVMEFDAINGSRLAYSPFDIDGDGTIGIYDTIRDGSQEIVVSGKRFGENIAAPSILANGNSEIILTSGSDGDTKATLGNAGPGADGIQGWTQL